MAIAQQLAGYTLGKADLLRRAMGKKKREVLDAEYVGFSEGMKANGFSDQSIKALWDVLVPFSDYAFNKAHSAAYGLVSYWTAYLKANYPAEYMAAVLTSVKDDKDKMAIYLNECRRMGIKVLPPDVNESDSNFTPVGTDIRFGLSAIRNVGVNVVAEIVAAREEKGRFTDFVDFIDKVSLPVCNKRVIESLAKAGSFDSMNHARRAVVAVHEQAVDEAIDLKRNEAHGQFDLFSMGDDADEGEGNSRLDRHRPRDRGVGQGDQARARARHARSVRVRPPAVRRRARAHQRQRLHDRSAARRRGPAGRHPGDDRRPGHRGPAEGEQARRHLRDRHHRGPRRFDRGDDVLLGVPVARAPAQQRRDHLDEGPAAPSRGPARAERLRGDRAGPDRGPERSGGDHDAGEPVYAAGGRATAGRAAVASRDDRGAAAAAGPAEDDGDADRRPVPGHSDRRR